MRSPFSTSATIVANSNSKLVREIDYSLPTIDYRPLFASIPLKLSNARAESFGDVVSSSSSSSVVLEHEEERDGDPQQGDRRMSASVRVEMRVNGASRYLAFITGFMPSAPGDKSSARAFKFTRIITKNNARSYHARTILISTSPFAPLYFFFLSLLL